MKTHILFVLLTISLFSCERQNVSTPGAEYLRHIGDIEHDSQVDSPYFKPCFADSLVYQYFNMSTGLQYEGEKIEIDNYFKKHYKPIKTNQSGWIRVRFIVNCKGETGRFRVLESDENFIEFNFDKKISSQLLTLTKEMKDWKTIQNEGSPIDYYQYLSFKINNGQVIKILP